MSTRWLKELCYRLFFGNFPNISIIATFQNNVRLLQISSEIIVKSCFSYSISFKKYVYVKGFAHVFRWKIVLWSWMCGMMCGMILWKSRVLDLLEVIKGWYTYDVHENCSIFRTPHPPCWSMSKILPLLWPWTFNFQRTPFLKVHVICVSPLRYLTKMISRFLMLNHNGNHTLKNMCFIILQNGARVTQIVNKFLNG